MPKDDATRIPATPLVGDYSWTKHGPFGWYSLDGFLCREIGARLSYWSEHAMSFPVEENPETGRFLTSSEWTAILAKHGKALLAVADNIANEGGENLETLLPAAKEAMTFLSDRLGSLWD